jgi:hypothetical protein
MSPKAQKSRAAPIVLRICVADRGRAGGFCAAEYRVQFGGKQWHFSVYFWSRASALTLLLGSLAVLRSREKIKGTDEK